MRVSSPKREARYRQLLQAALKIFARDGIDGSSVADIAEAAGVAKGSVYLYFDSKEALAGDLVRYLFTFDDDGPRLSEDPQPLQRILRFCENFAARVNRLGEESSVVLHMLGHVGKTRDDHLARGVRQLIAESRLLIRVLLRRAMDMGLVKGCDDCGFGASFVVTVLYGTIYMQHAMQNGNAGGMSVPEAIRGALKSLGADLQEHA